jgi:putative ABC transport system substrate-binding protein
LRGTTGRLRVGKRITVVRLATVVALLILIQILTVLCAPLGTEAQTAAKVPRIGVLGERSPADPFLEAFRQGLRDLGYAEGVNIAIEYRYLHGALDRVSDLAGELIRLKCDVLLVGGTVAARAAKAQTTTVPIVFTLAGDPAGSGLVSSLAHPGGNATGLSNVTSELSGKQLELLKAMVPRLARVVILYNPSNPAARSALNGAREAAPKLALDLQAWEVRRRTDLVSAFSAPGFRRAEAVLALSDPVIGNELAQMSDLAVKHRLPAIYVRREFPVAGGLLAYGPSFSHNYRRAATYVDRILKGAKPADLPVEQPTRFELVINLKTAKALGLTIPQSVLLQADEVIQ